MSHRFAVTVHYEDTDMGGIVYHANYLKFIERARSDWVAQEGVDQSALLETGVVFAVRKVAAEFRAPARFGETLDIVTSVREVTGARMVLRQEIFRDDRPLFRAEVEIVAIAVEGGGVQRMPAALRRLGTPPVTPS